MKNGSMTFFCQWVMHNSFFGMGLGDARGMSQSLLAIMGAIPMAVAVALVVPLANKFGRRKVTLIGIIVCVVGGVIAGLGNGSIIPVAIGVARKCLGSSPSYYLILAMLANVIDHIEFKHNLRTDGLTIYVKTATAGEIAKLDSTDSLNPTPNNSLTQAPTYGAKNGLTLIDMRGLSYDDANQLLDQLTAEDIKTLINYSGYGTPDLKSVQKPYALDADSATDLVFGDVGSLMFNGAEVLAQTWNIELAERFGNFVGNGALLGDITGWYCPAMNIHRTPFSSRNNEYCPLSLQVS